MKATNIKLANLNMELEYFGYKTTKNYLNGNKAYNECKNILWNITDKCSYINSKEIKKQKEIRISNLKNNVKEKSAILLEGVDLTTKYMSKIAFKIYTYCDYSVLERKAKNINIFDIPVKYSNFSFTTYYATKFFGEICPILVKHILVDSVNKCNDFLLEKDYIHELGHVLTQRKRETINNYLHKEFVPISLELLYSYINSGENGLNEAMASRLDITHSMMVNGYTSRDDATINNSYLISTLLSFQMLEKYMEFEKNKKKKYKIG